MGSSPDKNVFFLQELVVIGMFVQPVAVVLRPEGSRVRKSDILGRPFDDPGRFRRRRRRRSDGGGVNGGQEEREDDEQKFEVHLDELEVVVLIVDVATDQFVAVAVVVVGCCCCRLLIV